PMLDMSFQLLAFFVMTFKASSAGEGQLDLFLPKPQEPKAKDPSQIDVSKESSAEADEQADVTVSLAAAPGGELGTITVRDKGEKRIANGTVAEMCAALQAELKQRRAAGGAQANVKIEAESKLKYGRLVEVMDACLAAGYRQVGFAPPPDR